MHDDFRCELEENVLEQASSESEACPVGAVFKNLQTVSVELNITLKVHVVEGLQWDLRLSMVLQLIGVVLESEVVLDWASWQFNLLISARAQARGKIPE